MPSCSICRRNRRPIVSAAVTCWAGAVDRPRQHAFSFEADLADQAAVLAHDIAEGQPLAGGNKRTAMIALFAFLELNGWTIRTTEGRLAAQIHRLSEDLSAENLGVWIRASRVPCPAGRA